MKRNFVFASVFHLLQSATLLLASTACAATNIVEAPQTTSSTMLSTTKDIVNIVFFIVMGSLAILSYLQARKTLFTPIKTETFKLQLKIFEELLLYFENIRTTSLDHVFDIEKIFQLNTMHLMDKYVTTFLKNEVKLDEEKRNERYKDLIGGIIGKKDMEDWELVDDYIEKDKPEPMPELKNPAVILAKWQKYRHTPIEYTAKFSNEREQLERFIASPLLPESLKEHLRTFQEGVDNNLLTVGTILTEAAKELPEKYPTAKEIVKSQSYWLWHRYVRKRTLLEEETKKILDFITDYLNVESLVK